MEPKLQVLKRQAIIDLYKTIQALDASDVTIDRENDTAIAWSPDNGAICVIKLWQKESENELPSKQLDETLGAPETLHETGLQRSVASAIVPGMEFSPMVRGAVADVAERRRLASLSGSKDRSVRVAIKEGKVIVGQTYLEVPTFGEAETIVNGTYLQAAIDHCFGMVAYGVQLEIKEGGVLRILMQSPNQQNEPDTRWRGQAVMAPVVMRDRLEKYKESAE